MNDCEVQMTQAEVTAPDRAMSREAYALLAQANLLRMRGCWPEAIENCMAALKLAPEHPSAQSLLGDIYENLGRLDDAIQWYRMALDVQPDSPADKIKLSHLLERKARAMTPVLTPSAATALEESASEASSPFWHLVTRRVRRNPDALLRRTALGAGAAALLVVLLALYLAHGAAVTAARPSRALDVPTVIVPSIPSNDDPAPTPAPKTAADPAEQSLLTALTAAPDLSTQGITPVSVQADPRNSRLTLTLVCQPPGASAITRPLIERNALRVLQIAARAADPQTYSQFTVRCLLASASGGSTPLVFTADAARGAVAADNPDSAALSDSQIAGTFTAPWWSPAVPQP